MSPPAPSAGSLSPEQDRTGDVRKRKRTSIACETCRRSKLKCTGSQPCSTCERRSVDCIFLEDSRKVAVSARYLSSLRTQARVRSSFQSEPGPVEQFVTEPHTTNSSSWPGNEDGDFDEPSGLSSPVPQSSTSISTELNSAPDPQTNINWNPFPSNPTFLRNKRVSRRAHVYLAPSSTWGFNLRLTTMMLNHLHPDSANDIPFSLDGDAYSIPWTPLLSTSPDISGLPSQDYTIYLFNTVKFHLGQTFRLFDEESFMRHVHEFYDNASSKASQSRLWYSQFLLMLSLGKAFLWRSTTTSSEPPGAVYFVRAMASIPDMPSLWEDPILAMETFGLVALYLYSIDLRESAYLYVGQAVRIGIMEGLHLDFPIDGEKPDVLKRRSELWWTVYILDQRISASLGGPMSIPDHLISATLNHATQRDAILSLHVRVSRLICKVLQMVYSTGVGSRGSHLERIKSVLQEMAILARSLEEVIQSKFKSSVDTLPKGTIHAVLAFHHCTVLVIRPLLLVALNERLDNPISSLRIISTTFTSLVRKCVQAASRTLKLLTYLCESNLLETFLPFDLDFLFSSAIALTTIHVLFPNRVPDDNFGKEVDKILDEMVSKGNRVAELRKRDLERLRTAFDLSLDRERMAKSTPLASRPTTPGTMAPSRTMQDSSTIPSVIFGTSSHQEGPPDMPSGSSAFMDDLAAMNPYFPDYGATFNDLLTQIGISSNDMTTLANQIQHNSYESEHDWLWDPAPSA